MSEFKRYQSLAKLNNKEDFRSESKKVFRTVR